MSTTQDITTTRTERHGRPATQVEVDGILVGYVTKATNGRHWWAEGIGFRTWDNRTYRTSACSTKGRAVSDLVDAHRNLADRSARA